MNDHQTPDNINPPPAVADANVQRLLAEAYHPETPRPRICPAPRRPAVHRSRQAGQSPAPLPPDGTAAGLGRPGGPAALLVGIGIYAALTARLTGPGPRPIVQGPATSPSSQPAGFPLSSGIIPPGIFVGDDGLVARPRPDDPPVPTMQFGQTIHTQAGQRRRLALPDGSILYVNQSTRVTFDGPRQVSVEQGEVFLEVSPRRGDAGDAAGTFIVRTPARQVTAFGHQVRRPRR